MHPQTMYGRHLCLHRFKLWWLKPSHGHSGLNVPPETALLLAERRPPLPGTSNTCGTTAPPPPPPLRQQQQRQQEYVVLLPVSDTRARANLHRAGDKPSSSSSSGAVREHDPSALAVSADTGDAATPLPGKLGLLLVATGPDPFRLVRRLVLEATERLRAQLLSLSPRAEGERRPAAGADADAAGAGVAGGGVAVVPHGDGSARDGDDRGDIHEPEHALVASFLDTFGWCTWDSFYTMVTPEGTASLGRCWSIFCSRPNTEGGETPLCTESTDRPSQHVLQTHTALVCYWPKTVISATAAVASLLAPDRAWFEEAMPTKAWVAFSSNAVLMLTKSTPALFFLFF